MTVFPGLVRFPVPAQLESHRLPRVVLRRRRRPRAALHPPPLQAVSMVMVPWELTSMEVALVP